MPQPKKAAVDILRALQKDPTASDERVGLKVNLAPDTVQGWLKKLRTQGYVTERLRLADLVKAGAMLRYRIDITINPPALNKSCKDKDGKFSDCYPSESNNQRRLAYFIRDRIGPKFEDLIVEEVSILLGDPADLCATVLVPDHETIFKFVTEHLRALEEITSTSTSHVSWRTTTIFKVPEEVTGDRGKSAKKSRSKEHGLAGK